MPSRVRAGRAIAHYLYAISRANSDAPIALSGVAGASIETIKCDGLMCWVSKVPASDFEQKLAENMQNLDWVAGTSLAHQRAVSAIAKRTDILPARLATVFHNEESLVRRVCSEAEKIKRELARVKGADEWGIKVFAVYAPVEPRASVRSGKDYLKAKAALLPKRQTRGELDGDLAEFADALTQIAVESAAPGKVSSGQKGIVFQTSILVKRPEARKLASLLSKFSKRWRRRWTVECTGPWPPYSFVSRVEAD